MSRTRTIALCIGTLAVVVAGCQSSGVGKRKTERKAAYQSLSAESRKLVDKGKIQDGMDTNAVYIAWGQPTAVLHFDIPGGKQAVWTYEKRWSFQERRAEPGPTPYRGSRHSVDAASRGRPPSVETIDTFTTYAARSVVFLNGKVTRWQEHPPPIRPTSPPAALFYGP